MSNLSVSRNSGKDQAGLRITTLYMRPVAGMLKHYEILSHFSAFGDVSYVRIRKETKHSYGFVKFIQPESAAKALEVDSHIVAGREVHVAVAHVRYQEKISLQESNDGKTTFMDLNDHCIQEVLSMKSLTARDLLSVAESCRRLKEIASRAFRREHKKCDLRALCGKNAKTAKRILKTFGTEITDLQINGEDCCRQKWTGQIFDSVTAYCSNTLQSLDIENLKIPENITTELRPLFQRLTELFITKCTFDGATKELFADCGSLAILFIRGSDDVAAFAIENTFPKLEKVTVCFKGDSNLLESFIVRHMNLKSLRMCCSIGSSILQLIARRKGLEWLACAISQNDTLDLSNLSRLRQLVVECAHQHAMTTLLGLANLQLLEVLLVSRAEICSHFVRALLHLQTLQELKFLHCTGIHSLNEIGDLGQLTTLEILFCNVDWNTVLLMVQRFSKLNCLKIARRGFVLDLEMYSAIVDVVRRRSDRSKLTFTLYRNESHKYDHLLADFSRNSHLVEMILKDKFDNLSLNNFGIE